MVSVVLKSHYKKYNSGRYDPAGMRAIINHGFPPWYTRRYTYGSFPGDPNERMGKAIQGGGFYYDTVRDSISSGPVASGIRYSGDSANERSPIPLKI